MKNREVKLMSHCPYCYRTFFENKLKDHMNSCKSNNVLKQDMGSAKSVLALNTRESKSLSPAKVNPTQPLTPIPQKSFIRPKSVMCHICGKEFGTASIEIHIKNCQKLWEDREKLKPLNQRRPVPSSPVEIPISKTIKNLNEHNEIVYNSFNQNVMVRCPNCLRTFLEDRIEVHLKSCTPENPHKVSPSVNKSIEGSDVQTYIKKNNLKVHETEPKEQKTILKPKTVMCHICGKEFGTASIEIHLKSCAKLWEERESKKPAGQRRPIPEMPKDLPIGTSQKDLEKRNEIVNEAFNSNVMVQCPNCFRTFLEDRLEVHLRSCTSESPHKISLTPSISKNSKKPQANPAVSPKSAEKEMVRPKSIMCHICGRDFGTASIEIHLKSCAKLWEDRESKKPTALRRPVPSRPIDLPVSGTFKDIESHNQIISEHFNTSVLVPCPNCSRTFLEDRFEVHLRSCKSEKPHKPAPHKGSN